MSFPGLVLKNLLRQRIRTALTVLGISVGIMTVVALGSIATAVQTTAGEITGLGSSDFMVAQKGASDLTFSRVPAPNAEGIRRTPGVQSATGVLAHVTRVGSNPFFGLFGVKPDELRRLIPPSDRSGLATPSRGQIVLGKRAADSLGASPGETIEIDGRKFGVIGLYETGGIWVDNGGYAPLEQVQEIAKTPGVVTAVWVRAVRGADRGQVAERIEREYPELIAVRSAADYGEIDQGIEVVDSINLAISLLAIGIGAIGVMNTMVMSVFERTREIGILRAVGWSTNRIVRMVMSESLFLCLIAAFVGAGLGVLATRAVLAVPTIRSFLSPEYPLEIFARGLGVAVLVALAGALYPAYRAVRLTPMEALRHE